MLLTLVSFAFLSMSPSPYVNGVGCASTGLTGDYQVFWNPAGIEGRGFLSTYMNYSGLNYAGVGYITRFSEYRVGFVLSSFFSGNMVQMDENGESLGVFMDVYLVPGVSLAGTKGKLSYGFTLFLPYERVLGYRSYGAGINLGVQYRYGENLTIGILGRNIGYIFRPLVDYKYPLDYEVRFGGAYMGEDNFFSFDLAYPFNISIGAGFTVSDRFLFTGGYNSKFREAASYQSFDFLTGLNFGLGFNKGILRFSYTVLFMGDMGLAHNIGITVR